MSRVGHGYFSKIRGIGMTCRDDGRNEDLKLIVTCDTKKVPLNVERRRSGSSPI